MVRVDDGPPPEAVLLAVSPLSAGIAYVDLLGADLDVGDAWGGASLFTFATILAFLVPIAVVLRLRQQRGSAAGAWRRWPDVVLAAAGAALTCSVVARLIGEGSFLGLLAAVLGSAALAFAASRLPT